MADIVNWYANLRPYILGYFHYNDIGGNNLDSGLGIPGVTR